MRYASCLIAVLACLPLGLSAGEKEPRQDYAEFSRLVHKAVVSRLPKQFEDTSGWGQTILPPAKLPLPQLRTFLKVGDHLELPHGPWRRFMGKIEYPDKQLKIMVREFKQLDDKTYRVVTDVDATIMCHGEWQQWQKGLMLFGIEAVADADLSATIVCDIGVALNLKKFPPELNIDPRVAELSLDLVDFKIRNGPLLKGEQGERLRNDLKDVLRSLIKASEPVVKEYANQAIAQGLKEGKGTISAGAILKTLPAPAKVTGDGQK